MRFAYADPPYLGCCKLYDHYHGSLTPSTGQGWCGFSGECWDDVDTHKQLIAVLVNDFPDGWALSASMPSLKTLLPHCPDDVRIAPWCKSFCAFKRGVRPCYAWEPVIYWRGRNPPRFPHKPPEKGGKQTTPKDFLVAPITLKKGLTGAKPEVFCEWVLDLLNALPGDEVVDLFPGTGVMGRVASARLG